MADETEETEATEATIDGVTEPEAQPAVVAEAPTTAQPADDTTAEAPPVEAPAAPVAAATVAAVAVAPAEEGPRPNRRKVREGVVVSDAMQSTVVVAVVERVRHPRYGKTVQRTKKLYVHDAEDTAKVGDRVRVQETRPLSKLKRWRLTEVVERAR